VGLGGPAATRIPGMSLGNRLRFRQPFDRGRRLSALHPRQSVAVATSLSTSAAGALSSRSLIAKVYFPREIVSLSYIFAALADLAIATALTMAALACTGQSIPATAVGLLPICLILIIYAAALSLLLPIAQIGFRDIAIGLPLLLQGIMFTTPVLYTLDAVPDHWRAVYTLNPLGLLVEAFRGALVGKQIISAEKLVYAAVLGLILLGIVYFVFKTAEPDIVDERILDERPAVGAVGTAHSDEPTRHETEAEPGSHQRFRSRFEGRVPLATVLRCTVPTRHSTTGSIDGRRSASGRQCWNGWWNTVRRHHRASTAPPPRLTAVALADGDSS
jgi:hypothetical protein